MALKITWFLRKLSRKKSWFTNLSRYKTFDFVKYDYFSFLQFYIKIVEIFPTVHFLDLEESFREGKTWPAMFTAIRWIMMIFIRYHRSCCGNFKKPRSWKTIPRISISLLPHFQRQQQIKRGSTSTTITWEEMALAQPQRHIVVQTWGLLASVH